MTPTEQLNRASETLLRLARTADDAFEARDWETYDLSRAALLAQGIYDPDLARMLAGLMKAMSQAAYDDNYLDDELRAALALAEHINERASNG